MRRLPSLNGIRAFEAAARLESFVRAASELSVTAAAVSQQVKALEMALGVTLFRRGARGLRLTPDGAAYLPALSAALDGIAAATEQIRRRDVAGRLRITTLPSFATRWLLPRLGRLRALHPELDVDVHASSDNVDLRREGMDVAIRYGWGRWPGLHAEPLMEEEVFPVCAPALLTRSPLRRPADLLHHVLLHDRTVKEDEEPWLGWPRWLSHFGLADHIGALRGPGFSDSQMLLIAAEEGNGVAIGRTRLVGDALRAGRLVRPLAIRRPADRAYHMVCLPERRDAPAIRALRDWLAGEVAADHCPLE